MNGLNIFFMTAIFIAVIFHSVNVNAQEYNNWLFPGGTVLNFNTSPATIICNKNEEMATGILYGHTVTISDDNGEMLLYGYADKKLNSFMIKNFKGETIVSYKCPYVKNVIGAKLPQGGYYIAFVPFYFNGKGELCVYKFDKYGNFENEYIYDDVYYSFFIDILHLDNFISLIACCGDKIKVFKLLPDGCVLWQTSDVILDGFFSKMTHSYVIEHSLDNSKIIATIYDIVYVLNFDKNSGKLSIAHRFETNKFNSMAFSKTDKYFLIIDDNKLKGFRYDENFDFKLENPEIVYDLPNENDRVCNRCWEMAMGVDGKLYVHYQNADFIIVLDGIETGNILKEIIQSDCLDISFFPRISRYKDYQTCNARAEFDNASVCNVASLKITLSGTAPFEVFYTLDGQEKSFKTSKKEYVLECVLGKYQITRAKDAMCEFFPQKNNEIEVFPDISVPKIIEKN
ncbi:MAG: hypothetical protein IKR41_01735 [Bacteroidales bacterium]|nr:hypothetical protein [Bacteroidales bacterium]